MYVKGLLSNQPRKSIEPIALQFARSPQGGPAAQKEVVALQGFVDENSRRIEEQYLAVQNAAEETLKGRGLRYLFLDYVKGWTAKRGVPLPLP